MNRRFIKDKKYFIGALFALALIFGAVYFTRQSERPIEIKFDERGVVIPPEKGPRESQRDYAERIVDLQKGIKEMMKKDDVGGETPEETLRLFIDALKAGDTDLASKYFVLNDQTRALRELMELNQQQISEYINVLEIGDDISCNDISSWCELHGTYQGVNILIARFEQMQSGKWKLESL